MWILFTGLWMTRIAQGPGCELEVLIWICTWCQPAGCIWAAFTQRHSEVSHTETLQGARGSFQGSGACSSPPALWPLQRTSYWVSWADVQLVKPLGFFSPSLISSPDALFLANSWFSGLQAAESSLHSIHHLPAPSFRYFPLQECLEPLLPKCWMR